MVECTKKVSDKWGLILEENVAGEHSKVNYTIQIRTPDTKVCASIKVELVSSNHIVVMAKFGKEYRIMNFNTKDYAKFPPDSIDLTERLTSKLVATIFGPIFRPNQEYPNLSQLSVTISTIICSYYVGKWFLFCLYVSHTSR